MKFRFDVVILALVACAATAYGEIRIRPLEGERPRPTAAPTAVAAGPKTAVAGARLLLPYYEVDMTNPNGASTLYAVRNETAAPVEITISYFATDRPHAPQKTETVTLAGKQVRSTQIRTVGGLVVDDDGFARGYVVIAATAQEAVIQGDYFQVTPGQGFAAGSRLLNVDPASAHNDLCSLFVSRFLNGGAFTGGTRFTIWLDAVEAPTLGQPILYYSVYNEAGELRFISELYATEVATTVSAADLVAPIPTAFGAIEFELNGLVGHVSTVMSATGLYTVGLKAACSD